MHVIALVAENHTSGRANLRPTSGQSQANLSLPWTASGPSNGTLIQYIWEHCISLHLIKATAALWLFSLLLPARGWWVEAIDGWHDTTIASLSAPIVFVWNSKHSQFHLLLECMNFMKLVILLHFISCEKDSKRCSDTTTPESIHTKDESKRVTTFAFIFGVNWPVQWM